MWLEESATGATLRLFITLNDVNSRNFREAALPVNTSNVYSCLDSFRAGSKESVNTKYVNELQP